MRNENRKGAHSPITLKPNIFKHLLAVKNFGYVHFHPVTPVTAAKFSPL